MPKDLAKPKLPLHDLCEQIVDCPHSTPVWTDCGVVVLRNQNIRNGRLDLSSPSYTDEEHYRQRVRRADPRAGDLVITREAPMGEVCQIPPGLRCCLGQRMVLLRPDKTKCDDRYLLYALQSHEVRHEIFVNEGTGSTVSNLRIPLLERLAIPFIPLKEQQAIACILGSLDDKIELNRRMNRTLEGMARAIFKSWFVDFDPVRAKAAGKPPPGLKPALSNLFPDRFEDSELGEIPKGWRAGSVLEVADLLSGGTPKTSDSSYWGGGIPWASAADVSQCGQMFLIDTERTITQTGLDNSATQIIPALASVVVARGATTGRMAMFGSDIAMNQTCYALRTKHDTPRFLYFLLQHEIDGLVQTAHGSVFDTITTATFRASKIVHPAGKVAEAFERMAAPFAERILSNLYESRTLAALRDALLPKLISGDLRLPDAERIAARAV